MAEQINTVGEVIDRLGGNAELGRKLGVTGNAVGNWRDRDGGFPAPTFMAITELLNAQGLYAPPSLWRWAPLKVTESA